MKIAIVNTSDIRGGAAIAAFRLFKVIHADLPETRMLVRDKLTAIKDISGLNNSVSFYVPKTRIYGLVFLPQILDKI
jgi:hypothetical protein